MINWNLVKQPMNWLVIILMLVIGAMAGHLVLSYFGVEPSTSDDTPISSGTGAGASENPVGAGITGNEALA